MVLRVVALRATEKLTLASTQAKIHNEATTSGQGYPKGQRPGMGMESANGEAENKISAMRFAIVTKIPQASKALHLKIDYARLVHYGLTHKNRGYCTRHDSTPCTIMT